MNQPKQGEPPLPDHSGAAAPGPPALNSAELLAGGREILIRHGDDVYRLKLTGNNKLILTK